MILFQLSLHVEQEVVIMEDFICIQIMDHTHKTFFSCFSMLESPSVSLLAIAQEL